MVRNKQKKSSNHRIVALFLSYLFGCVGSLVLAEEGYEDSRINDDVVERKYKDGRRTLIVRGTELEDRTPAPEPAPQHVTKEEETRGFVVYRRKTSDAVFRSSSPRSGERIESLGTATSRGEKRHVQFAVRALRDLGRVDVVIGSLKEEDGGALPALAVTVRPVRVGLWRNYWNAFFREAPKLIGHPGASTTVVEGQSQQFWIRFDVSRSATVGRYAGELRIKTEKAGSATLKLDLEVYPFELVPGRWWGVFYYGTHAEKTSQDFADMKAHGVNSMLVCPPGHRVPVLERKGDRVVASFPETDKLMAELKRQGFRGPISYFPRLLSCRVLELFDRVDGKKFKHADYYGQSCVNYKAEDYPEDLKEVLKDVFRQMVRHAKAADWPEILWFLVDEPAAGATHGTEMEWAKVEFPLFAEVWPDEKLLCTAYSREALDLIGVKLDVRVCDLWRLGPDDMQRARRDEAKVWGLRWLCQHNTYEFPRHFAGLGLDRMGLHGFAEWTYYGAPLYRPHEQLVHFQGCHYSFEDEKGNLLSTIPWEGVQEGIDDARYVATLRTLIRQGESSSDSKHRELVRIASRRLERLIASIPERPAILPEAELDRIRREIAGSIVRLIDSGLSLQ